MELTGANRASWNSGGRGREIRFLSFKGWEEGLYISAELNGDIFEDTKADGAC
jgi:hypothetical protein